MAIKKETTADRMKTDPKEALGAEPGSSSQGKIHKEVQKSIELLEKYQRAREVWGQHFFATFPVRFTSWQRLWLSHSCEYACGPRNF